jgi:hypothetical protein
VESNTLRIFPESHQAEPEVTVVLATVVSMDASATFAVVAFAILMETFSISASMGMDIRIITRTPTRITIRILIRTTRCIEG